MIWKKILDNKKNRKDAVCLILWPFIILILTALSIFFVVNIARQSNQSKFFPEKVINISEVFSGQVYFNDELGSDDFVKLITANINRSQASIELAMYSLDNKAIRDALFLATMRGLKVDLIFSTKHKDNLQNFFKEAPEGISVKFVGDDEGDAYMHHKFLLLDRGLDSRKLFFGSYNFTDIQGKFDPSFILETSRPEIIEAFGVEFDSLTDLDYQARKKAPGYNPFAAKINYPEGYLEIWFTPESPVNSLKSRMINLINGAKSKIESMIWHLTDRDVAAALVSAAKNIPVKIIVDDFNLLSPQSMLPAMLAQKQRQNINKLAIINDSKRNAEILYLKGEGDLNSFLHHHLLLIDGEHALFGTNNWSFSGFLKNDESIMITNIPALVKSFSNSFDYNYQENR